MTLAFLRSSGRLLEREEPGTPLTADGLEGRGAVRSRRIRLAIRTSIASKGVTIAVQLLAFPLAVRALGAERFGVFVLLTTALAWMSIVYSGLGPGLARGVAEAAANGDQATEARYFTAGIILSAALIAVLGLAVSVWWLTMPTNSFPFSAKFLAYRGELRSAFPLVLLIIALQLIVGVADSARAGYQEQYVTNLWGIIANCGSLLALVVASLFSPTIAAMVVAVYGVAVLGRVGNLATLLKSRPYLLPRLRLLDRVHMRAVLHTGGAFAVLQAGVFINQQVSLVLLGRLTGPTLVGQMAVQFRVFALLGGMIQMVIQPFWPAVIDARVQNHWSWIRQSYRKVVAYCTCYALVGAIGVSLLGRYVVSHWVGAALSPPQTFQTIMGLYFFLCIWPQPHAALLMGLGKYWPPAWISLSENTLMILLAVIMIPRFGITGLAASLCVANVATSGWLIPRLAHVALGHNIKKPNASS